MSEENVQREKIFEINIDDVVTDRWIGRHGPEDRAYSSDLLDHRISSHAIFTLGFCKGQSLRVSIAC